MPAIRRLERLYAKIPSFTCKEHCSECCGLIRWFDLEDRNIRNYLREHGMDYRSQNITFADLAKYVMDGDDSGITCPYVENDRCTIYPARPLICRLQGLADKLPCPHVKPERILSKDEIDELFREMSRL
jgi:Fe-S-cluster containining protein